MISGLMAWLGTLVIDWISSMGYAGLVFLMALESIIFPLPSELVMPFAGFIASRGDMSFIGVIVFSAIGSLIGSLIAYYAGRYLGIPVIEKIGSWIFVDAEDLEKTEKWFEKKGESTIFISRFIPIVRHFISIPAGVARMDLKKFCLYTFIGAGIWNAFLAWLGWLLGEHWEEVRVYTEWISYAVAILLLIGIVWFVYKHIGKKISRKN